jgi:hypothetical protein
MMLASAYVKKITGIGISKTVAHLQTANAKTLLCLTVAGWRAMQADQLSG